MRRLEVFVAISLLLVCRSDIVRGQTLTPLWQFGSLSNQTDGITPWSGLIQGHDGNFYGTAGGTNLTLCTVFKITPAGALTPLWQFGSLPNVADGTSPLAGLIQGSDGDFYGTTSRGGNNLAFGTAFKITAEGTLTTLWDFGSLPSFADGTGPCGSLVQGTDGNFYGTTQFAGTHNRGTVFKLTSAGTLTPLWQFGSLSNNADGNFPGAGLVQGTDGNFYGTTAGGGTHGGGTVFQITSAGTLTPLWQFGSLPGSADGGDPAAALIQGSDGNFYGTTQVGGTNGLGIVFRITSAGTLTPLWQFGSLPGFADGAIPEASLVEGSDGNFYGTTGSRGTNNNKGTVFQITPAGTLTPLWQFGSLSNNADGAAPLAGLVQGSDGSFYGTTSLGGTNGKYGTVFKLTVPLNPPANQTSCIRVIDTNVVLAIPSVAGETYQLQYRADLTSGDWSNIAEACVSNSLGGLLTFTNIDATSSPQRFYRFDITP